MKKNYFLLTVIAFLYSIGNLSAQAGLYTLSANPGTYTPISGGIDVDAVEADDKLSTAQPIGFNFVFDGATHTQFKMSSNGFISFNMTGTGNQSSNNLDFVTASSRPLIAPLWDDLDGRDTSSASQASYLLSGTAPNRVLTIEWLNWEWNLGSQDSVISFQVKLYETSNKIEFVYRQETGVVNSGSASIGLTGVSSYLSLTSSNIFPTTSNTRETANINSKPATGQVYTFTSPTCPPPSGLVASAITASTATLNWTASSSAWYYDVEYGPAGFTPGTGTMDSARGTTLNLSGLVGYTDYDVYVRSKCNILDSSLLVGPISFKTACIAFIPTYIEDFTTSYAPDCWSQFQGRLGVSSTPMTGSTSDWTNGNFGNSGSNKSARLNIYDSDHDEWLVSPTIDLGSTSSYQVEFDVALTEWLGTTAPSNLESDDTLAFVISTDNGITWSQANILEVWKAGKIPSNTGDHIIINLSPYSGLVKFGFYIASSVSGSEDSDLFVDNFKVIKIPTCLVPTALSSSTTTGVSSTLSWTDNNTPTSPRYEISYGSAGFTAGSGTQIDTTSNPFNLTGLIGNTNYDWYVRAICGAGDTSFWSNKNSFTTLPSCLVPTTLISTNLSADSADISWTDNNTSAPGSWQVSYGVGRFTAGSGTQIVMTADSGTLSSLIGNTTYNWYVRAICGAGDTSDWSRASSFTTPCAPFTPTFIEDFTTSYAPDCWSQAKGQLGATSTTFTSTTSSLWTSDGFGNVGSSGSARMNVYSTGRAEWLITPSIDLGSTTAYQTEFDIALTNYSATTAPSDFGADDTLAIVISTDNGVTWSQANILEVWKAGKKPSNTGDHVTIDLSSYTGIVKFGFYAASSASGGDRDVFIDNFKVIKIPTCAVPTALISTDIGLDSANISWIDNNTSTPGSWQISYGVAGFTAGYGNQVIMNSNSGTLSSLLASTMYEWYVRTICGAGDTSAWSSIAGSLLLYVDLKLHLGLMELKLKLLDLVVLIKLL